MTVPHRVLLAAWLVASLPACAEASGASPGTGAPPPSAAPANAADHETYSSPAPPTVDAKTSPCPQGMAQIERYCIDSYEAHLISRGADGEATPHPYFERPEEGVTYEARSEAGVYPQAYVSRIEAKAACMNAGKRLCSLAEWQRACKGEAGTTYPYGARWQSARCNTGKRHLLTLRFGADTIRWGYAQFNDPSLDQEPGFLAKTGEYEGCVSDAGIHDLVGNLHEWVSDTAGATLKARLDSDGISRAFQYWSPGNGVFMGGFYSTHAELGPGCAFTTIAHEPGYHDYSTGFRCCADAG